MTGVMKQCNVMLTLVAALLGFCSCVAAVQLCGTSYSNAKTRCDKCPKGLDGECPNDNDTCYATDLSECRGKGPASSKEEPVNLCGSSFGNAMTRCDKCPKGLDGECPNDDDTCYATDLPDCPNSPSPNPPDDPGDCSYAEAAGRDISNLCANQIRNAKVIIDVGRDNDIPRYGWVVAIAAALVESRLVNVDFGDRDSVGLFQQRCRAGWCECGTGSECGVPVKAARAFYGVASHTSNPGLEDQSDWQDMSVSDAAQAVQISCCPKRYGEQEPLARDIVSAFE